MLAALLALAVFSAGPQPGVGFPGSPFVSCAEDVAPGESLRDRLHESLMDKVHAMNNAQQGIFQNDISPMVAPFFPLGQSFAETARIIKEQDLGNLQKFKGMQDPAGGTMYVAKFNLMNGMFSEVYVVLNFDFDGTTESDMTLKKAGGYLRGGNM